MIPDDVEFGIEELPADFWDSPAATKPGEPGEPVARVAPEVPEAPEAPEAPEVLEASSTETPAPVPGPAEPSDGEDVPPTDLEQAFDQLQSLFPGRVVEVRPPATDEAVLDGLAEPLHDELAAEGGYDDDDQDRLPFGPGSD